MAFTRENKDDKDFGKDFGLLFKASQATGAYSLKFLEFFKEGKMGLIPLAATRFLECFSETVLANLLLEQGLIARKRLGEVDPNSADGIFYRGKIETAKYFCRNILTNVFARYTSFEQEDTSAIDMPEEAF